MSRKDYPWHAPDIKFGSNAVVNIILILILGGYYGVMGFVYLMMIIIELVNLIKSSKQSSSSDKSEDSNKITNLTSSDRQRWLVLVNDRACDYARCFEENSCIYINTRKKRKPSIGDTVFIYTAKGRRVRFKTQVIGVDVQRHDSVYWKSPQPDGLTCKLQLLAEYKGWALCESNLKLKGEFGGVETIEYPMCNNLRLLDYIEEHFNDLENVILADTADLLNDSIMCAVDSQSVDSLQVKEPVTQKHLSKKTKIVVAVSLIIATIFIAEFVYIQHNVKKLKGQEPTVVAVENNHPKDSIPQKDSIDVLIELRAQEDFTSTIFAGLRFGSSSYAVENTMRDDSNRTILVPYGDEVKTVSISRKYKAEYYNGGLASLTLYTDNMLREGLNVLFSAKYGVTKNHRWEYANCIIEIQSKGRREWNPDRDKGYRSAPTGMYYDSYDGTRTSSLTRNSSFLVISYKNTYLLDMIEKQKIEQDSLRKVQEMKEIEAERELAKKLATEIPTNI